MRLRYLDDLGWNSFLNPAIASGVALLICLIALLGYSLQVERMATTGNRGWRYYRAISLRRWLWAVYLGASFAYLIAFL